MIPTEAIPGLIRYQGQKHKDTEMRTNTKIAYTKVSEVLSSARITGKAEDCRIARALINMAIGHSLASMKTEPASLEQLGEIHAAYDIKTIFFEIQKNKE